MTYSTSLRHHHIHSATSLTIARAISLSPHHIEAHLNPCIPCQPIMTTPLRCKPSTWITSQDGFCPLIQRQPAKPERSLQHYIPTMPVHSPSSHPTGASSTAVENAAPQDITSAGKLSPSHPSAGSEQQDPDMVADSAELGTGQTLSTASTHPPTTTLAPMPTSLRAHCQNLRCRRRLSLQFLVLCSPGAARPALQAEERKVSQLGQNDVGSQCSMVRQLCHHFLH